MCVFCRLVYVHICSSPPFPKRYVHTIGNINVRTVMSSNDAKKYETFGSERYYDDDDDTRNIICSPSLFPSKISKSVCTMMFVKKYESFLNPRVIVIIKKVYTGILFFYINIISMTVIVCCSLL